MLRIFLIALVGTTLIACEGCSGANGTHNHSDPQPPANTKEKVKDYVPAIALALDSSVLAFDTWTNKAVEKQKFGECIAATTLSSAAKVSKEILVTEFNDADEHIIPSPKLDFAACTPLKPEAFDPKSADTVAALSTAEGALNIAISGVSIYLPKIKDCKSRVLVQALVKYLQGALGPVLEEVKAPDGKLEIPAVTFSFEECAEVSGIPLKDEDEGVGFVVHRLDPQDEPMDSPKKVSQVPLG